MRSRESGTQCRTPLLPCLLTATYPTSAPKVLTFAQEEPRWGEERVERWAGRAGRPSVQPAPLRAAMLLIERILPSAISTRGFWSHLPPPLGDSPWHHSGQLSWSHKAKRAQAFQLSLTLDTPPARWSPPPGRMPGPRAGQRDPGDRVQAVSWGRAPPRGTVRQRRSGKQRERVGGREDLASTVLVRRRQLGGKGAPLRPTRELGEGLRPGKSVAFVCLPESGVQGRAPTQPGGPGSLSPPPGSERKPEEHSWFPLG